MPVPQPHRSAPDANCKHAVVSTAWGWLGLLRTDRGLRKLTLPRPSQEDALRLLSPGNSPLNADAFGDLPRRLQAYFLGQLASFSDELDIAGTTPFQQAVWQALRTVSYGQVRTYGWLAAHVGRPRAARAVGQAVGANPLPIVIPCHRIMASGGGLGGWSGGDIGEKVRLLDMEKGGARGSG